MTDHSARFSRVILEASPFSDFEAASHGTSVPWSDFDRWPARWILPSPDAHAPFLSAFRLDFSVHSPLEISFHMSAHERYELYLVHSDELQLIGRGPTRCVDGFRHFETFDICLEAGNYSFVARVSCLEKLAPWAQTAGKPGFLFAVQDETLWDTFSTGRAQWQTRIIEGISWVKPSEQIGRAMGGGAVEISRGDALSPWWWRDGVWQPAIADVAGNNGFTLYLQDQVPLLRPSPLPALYDSPWRDLELIGADTAENETTFGESSPERESDWASFWDGAPMEIPPHSRRRFWLRSGDYLCAFPEIRGSNGAGSKVRLSWAESLRDEENLRLHLAPFQGAKLIGIWDEVRPDQEGEWHFAPMWWRCGLFLRLDIETGDSPLELRKLVLHETRYPFEIKNHWAHLSPEIDTVFQKCVRTLQVCAHETYMDCPYYEQLQYIGDTRVQILCSYAIFNDDRLARHAIWLLDTARKNPAGWMPSSAPSRDRQSIPTFALWWIEMLHDFARLRGDLEFVQPFLRGARDVAEEWLSRRDKNGLVALESGWNYLDAVGDLTDLRGPFHGALGWQVAGTIQKLGELEDWCDEPELASRMDRIAHEIADANQSFWCEAQGLFADDREKTKFSQHTNVLALLSNLLDTRQKMRIESALFDQEIPGLTKASIYFSHYVFAAAKNAQRHDWLQRQLDPWLHLASQGLTTTPEKWGDTRSECHAWGAHPLLHF